MSDKTKEMQYIQSLKKGGKVKKTGMYKLHKGERVIKKKVGKLIEKQYKNY